MEPAYRRFETAMEHSLCERAIHVLHPKQDQSGEAAAAPLLAKSGASRPALSRSLRVGRRTLADAGAMTTARTSARVIRAQASPRIRGYDGNRVHGQAQIRQ